MKLTYEFSDTKDRLNRRDHGITLERAVDFDMTAAIVDVDDSQDYGEERYIAVGFLAGSLYVMVFTALSESHMRVISLRKAEKSEERLYAEY